MSETWSTEEVVEWVTRRLSFEAFLSERSTWPTAVRPAPAPVADEEPPASVA
jgi:hypothetical protein